jgi:DNA topoisomerase-3
MERGKLKRATFMKEIARMTERIVKTAKEYNNETIPGDYTTLKTPCPNCGGVIKENYRRFACDGCEFSITKIPGGRQFEIPEVEQLLQEREIGPLQGFRSKMGRPFAAILRIVPDKETSNFKLEFDFGNSNPDDEPEEIDFSTQQALGDCPKCGGKVYEHGMNYVCENTPAKKCDFRSGKVILRQEIQREQMQKLLKMGRTDLLDAFVSNRNGRRFKAFLVRQPDGKVGFEFAPRAAKAGADDSAAKPVKVKKATPAAVEEKPVRSKKRATKAKK